MLDSELDLLSFSRDLRHFDAHVYYDEISRGQALALREKALFLFQGKTVFVGRMIDYPIGPHPVPMFEINFPKYLAKEVSDWLARERGKLTILIHEVTGDDHRDHTIGANWLGTPFQLDTSKFK